MSYEQLKKHFESNSNNSNNLTGLEDKLKLKEEFIKLKEEFIEERGKRIEELEKELNDKKNELVLTKNDLLQIQTQTLEKEKSNKDLKMEMAKLDSQQKKYYEKYVNIKKDKDNLEEKISKSLQVLSKIDKTFFGSTGNKGKSVLAEKQLDRLLEKSGLPKNLWVNNLTVGSKTVEFAIRSGIGDKWIPIDSKVLNPELDGDNKIIMNEKYLKKVITQVKKVTEYTNKKNTEAYGLLVLQNDDIYIEINNFNSTFFQKMIRDHKIYITSPSSFIQFASSISHIIDIYEKVHRDEILYKEILSLIDTTTKFGVTIKDSYTSMKTAVETHYPILEGKQNKIQTQLGEEKIKKLSSLDEKNKYKKLSSLNEKNK